MLDHRIRQHEQAGAAARDACPCETYLDVAAAVRRGLMDPQDARRALGLPTPLADRPPARHA